jgi:hypothetical protein
VNRVFVITYALAYTGAKTEALRLPPLNRNSHVLRLFLKESKALIILLKIVRGPPERR